MDTYLFFLVVLWMETCVLRKEGNPHITQLLIWLCKTVLHKNWLAYENYRRFDKVSLSPISLQFEEEAKETSVVVVVVWWKSKRKAEHGSIFVIFSEFDDDMQVMMMMWKERWRVKERDWLMSYLLLITNC